MFLSKAGHSYNIILIGRESDISIHVQHEPSTLITLSLRSSVDDQSAHEKTMPPAEAVAVIYKLWNDGALFPSKMLIHLQNDVINHILNTTYGSEKKEEKE